MTICAKNINYHMEYYVTGPFFLVAANWTFDEDKEVYFNTGVARDRSPHSSLSLFSAIKSRLRNVNEILLEEEKSIEGIRQRPWSGSPIIYVSSSEEKVLRLCVLG